MLQFWLSERSPHPDEIGGQQGVVLRWLGRHPGATAEQIADGVAAELRTRQGARKVVNWYLYRVWPRRGWVVKAAGNGRSGHPVTPGTRVLRDGSSAGSSFDARVSTKGQVAIPARLRRRLGITPGTRIVFIEEAGSIEIVPITPAYLRSFRGVFKLKPGERSAVEELLEDKRRDKAKESRW